MLNNIEESRKNELMTLMDSGKITTAQLMELRELTNKGISHMVFATARAS